MLRLIVMQWSIFTLSTQLILCASIYSNNNDSLSSFDELPGSTSSSQPRFKSEILCNSQEQDKFLSDFGLESSLLLDLNPGRTIHSCKRFFSSPDSNGLLIRLIKSSEIFNDSSTIVDNFKENNISEFCPISITPMSDGIQLPWRFDPCQMEMNDVNEEPARIIKGRVKVLWVHGSSQPNFKLSITSISKNEACKTRNKHACLKFGDDPLLCISDDLVCDGIRQCPLGNGMLSDEDESLCRRHRLNSEDYNNFQKSSIWQHLTLGIFQNIFGPIESTSAISSMNPQPSVHHVDASSSVDFRPTIATHLYNDLKTAEINERFMNAQPKIKPQEPPEMRFIKTPKRMNNKNNNLSRYGSWGYMMLGMLMCSVVLLMCGIWECIRRVQKNDIAQFQDQFQSNGEQMETMSSDREDDNNCPQYDPPPPYSSLFPLAKDFNSETTNGDSSAPASIYFTATSAAFLPSAPSAPNSLVSVQLPQNAHSHRLWRNSEHHQQQQQQQQEQNDEESSSPA